MSDLAETMSREYAGGMTTYVDVATPNRDRLRHVERAERVWFWIAMPISPWLVLFGWLRGDWTMGIVGAVVFTFVIGLRMYRDY